MEGSTTFYHRLSGGFFFSFLFFFPPTTRKKPFCSSPLCSSDRPLLPAPFASYCALVTFSSFSGITSWSACFSFSPFPGCLFQGLVGLWFLTTSDLVSSRSRLLLPICPAVSCPFISAVSTKLLFCFSLSPPPPSVRKAGNRQLAFLFPNSFCPSPQDCLDVVFLHLSFFVARPATAVYLSSQRTPIGIGNFRTFVFFEYPPLPRSMLIASEKAVSSFFFFKKGGFHTQCNPRCPHPPPQTPPCFYRFSRCCATHFSSLTSAAVVPLRALYPLAPKSRPPFFSPFSFRWC